MSLQEPCGAKQLASYSGISLGSISMRSRSVSGSAGLGGTLVQIKEVITLWSIHTVCPLEMTLCYHPRNAIAMCFHAYNTLCFHAYNTLCFHAYNTMCFHAYNTLVCQQYLVSHQQMWKSGAIKVIKIQDFWTLAILIDNFCSNSFNRIIKCIPIILTFPYKRCYGELFIVHIQFIIRVQ